MKRRALVTTLGAAALAAVPAGLRAAVADGDPWRALAGPGTALLLRHAQTDPGIGDPPGFRLDDCSTQRNLSAAGRAQANRIGDALRARGLRFDDVLSSRWCRCLDTARLIGERLDPPAIAVQPFDPINSFFEDRRTEPQQTAALRAHLAQLGRRRVLMVTHMVNIAALAGTSVAMGEGVVVDAPGGRVRVRGRVRVD